MEQEQNREEEKEPDQNYQYDQQQEQGWDPEIKKYFVRIINTIAWFLLWLMGAVTAGLYFRLAYRTEQPFFLVIIYYAVLIVTLFLLLRYYYRVWRK